MATEYESLRLNVSLVDNVTSQLEKIRGSLTNLGGGQAGAGLEKLKRQTGELTEQIKGLATGFGGGSEAALAVAKSLGLATAGIAAGGVALVKGVQSLNDYTKAMQELGRLSTQTGLGAAQIKEMSEAMQRSGIDAGRAQTNIAGLARAMSDITRVNSAFRQRLLSQAGQGSDRAAMEALLGDLGRVANNPAAFVKKLQDAQDQIYNSMLARTGSATRAAEARKNFLADVGLPDLAEFRGEFATVSKAAEDMMAGRIAQANEFQEVTTRIGQSWGKIAESIQAVLTPAATAVLKPLSEALRVSAEQIEGAMEAMRTFEPPEWLRTMGASVKEIGDTVAGALNAINAGAEALGKQLREMLASLTPPEWVSKLAGAVGGAQAGVHAAGTATREVASNVGAAVLAKLPKWAGGKQDPLEAAASIPTGFQHGGAIGAGQVGLVGEAGPELFQPGQSGSILPNWLLQLMVKESTLGSWASPAADNPAASMVSATGFAGLATKWAPLLSRLAGPAAGVGTAAGIAAAPGLTGSLTPGGMQAAIASDDAERAEFYDFIHKVRAMLGLEGGGAGKRQAGGPVTGGGGYTVGEAGAELFMAGGGQQGGGEGRRLVAEQNRQVQELNANTEDQNAQMRRLTDELQTLNQAIAGPAGAPSAPGGGVRMAGLRGLPGFGGGGGAYAGGGGYAGAGGGPGGRTRISGFGGGTRGGGATGSWGESAYGGGTTPSSTGLDAGNQTGASPTATAGPAGDPNVPAGLLETARTVALTGGPQALDKFMRDNGYPRNGAWCGQFAASVVKSQGLQPPKNPEVASNWRNWGEEVTGAPQPGDVAIRKGGRTGSTGSHVTFVSGHDPQTGRVSTIGGNQALSPGQRARGMTGESRDLASRYEYRRAPTGGGVKPYGSDVGAGAGGGFAGGGGTSGGAGATARYGAPAGGGGRGGRGDLYGQRAPMLMGELQDDLGLTRDQAAGLVGNLGYESAGFKSLQEGAPIGGAAGGYGYAQWTGPRRRQFEKFARDNQLDPSSHEANAGFLKHELTGSHAGFLQQLKGTKNLAEATRLTHEVYERPADVQPRYWGTRLPGGRVIKPYESAAGRAQYAQRAHALDRRELDQQMASEVNHKVEGTGKLTVDVNAPAGTKVAAEGGGLFKKVETNRQTQMARASEGPTVAV